MSRILICNKARAKALFFSNSILPSFYLSHSFWLRYVYVYIFARTDKLPAPNAFPRTHIYKYTNIYIYMRIFPSYLVFILFCQTRKENVFFGELNVYACACVYIYVCCCCCCCCCCCLKTKETRKHDVQCIRDRVHTSICHETGSAVS